MGRVVWALVVVAAAALLIVSLPVLASVPSAGAPVVLPGDAPPAGPSPTLPPAAGAPRSPIPTAVPAGSAAGLPCAVPAWLREALGGAALDERCLVADPWLLPAVEEVATVLAGVVLQVEPLDAATAAVYRRRGALRVIAVQPHVVAEVGPRELGAILAHELQHAADDVAGLIAPGPWVTEADRVRCFADERRAVQREVEVWLAMWGGTPPLPATAWQHLFAGRLRLVQGPAEALDRYVRTAWAASCALSAAAAGGGPPFPSLRPRAGAGCRRCGPGALDSRLHERWEAWLPLGQDTLPVCRTAVA